MNEQVFTDIGVEPSTVSDLFELLADLRRAAGTSSRRFAVGIWKVV